MCLAARGAAYYGPRCALATVRYSCATTALRSCTADTLVLSWQHTALPDNTGSLWEACLASNTLDIARASHRPLLSRKCVLRQLTGERVVVKVQFGEGQVSWPRPSRLPLAPPLNWTNVTRPSAHFMPSPKTSPRCSGSDRPLQSSFLCRLPPVWLPARTHREMR